MIRIHKATIQDIPLIQSIAYKTWPVAYGSIISEAQIAYMLNAFYTTRVLVNNMIHSGHHFTLAFEKNEALGFASFEHNYQNLNKTRIHKLYILPNTQGKGIGKKLLINIEQEALTNQSDFLNLNVNKYNPAKDFYHNMGFNITKEFDLDIGNGYWMEDFIMEKELK